MVANTPENPIPPDVATLQQEVVALRQQVTHLQQAQRQFQTLADNIPGMLYVLRHTPDGTMAFSYVSSGCYALLELEPIVLQQQPDLLWQLFHPDDSEAILAAIHASAASLNDFMCDWRMITPSGRMKWVSGVFHPERLPDDSTLWSGYMVDVSDRYAALEERKQAEADIKAQQQIQKAILDNIPHRIWYKDADSRYIAVNEVFCQAIDLRPEDLIGRDEYEIWQPEQAQMFIETDQAAIASGQPYYMERCIPLADGTFHWVMTIKTPVYDDVGNVLGTTGVSMDITPRKQAELTVQQLNAELEIRVEERTAALQNALAESQALNAILDNLADGLLVTNVQGQIMRYNPALVKMFALDNLNLHDRDCHHLAQPKLTALVDQLQQAITATTTITEADEHIATAELQLTSNRIGQAVATPIFKQTPDGTTSQWLGCAVLIRDVTTEREIDRIKTEFIATVSHELRTPLTSVLGFTSIIRDRLSEEVFPLLRQSEAMDSPKATTPIAIEPSTSKITLARLNTTFTKIDYNLAIIIAEAERLTSLINDLLDIAKMEAGEVDWHMQPTSPTEIVDWAIHATSALFETSGLTLCREIAPNLPDVLGDHNRLIQVMINLISNAIKFTEHGSITVSVRLEGEEWRTESGGRRMETELESAAELRLPPRVLFSVTDTGIGIAPDNQEKVFDRFQQLGDMMTNKPKGTGLGLSICKEIVEHHGGKIWVEGELGLGSTFSFSLPAIVADTQPAPIASIEELVRQFRQQDFSA